LLVHFDQIDGVNSERGTKAGSSSANKRLERTGDWLIGLCSHGWGLSCEGINQ
jgi:hypothetical protein